MGYWNTAIRQRAKGWRRVVFDRIAWTGILRSADLARAFLNRDGRRLLWLRMRSSHDAGRPGEALELARAAVRQFPDDPGFLAFLLERELESAEALLKRGQFADALAAADRVTPRTAGHRRKLLWLRMRSSHRIGQSADTLEIARDAVRQFPKDKEFQKFLAERELDSAYDLFNQNKIEGKAIVDLAVGLLQRPELSLPPRRIHWLSRVIVQNDLTEDLVTRLDSVPEAPAAATLLLGLIQIAQGAQLAGVGLCRQALAGKLAPDLGMIADAESTAATFHNLGSRQLSSEPALVLIEPKASPDVMRLAFDRAAVVHVYAGLDFSPQAVPALKGFWDDQRLVPVKFRASNVPEIGELMAEFSRRFIRSALDNCPLVAPLGMRGADHVAALETALRVTLFGPMQWLFNAMEAIKETGARRIFMIANEGWHSLPLANHLLRSHEPYEVWMASGSPHWGKRKAFSEAFLSSDPLERLAELRLAGGAGDIGGWKEGRHVSPFVDVSSPSRPATKKHCIVCALTAGQRVAFPLRAVLERLLPDWDPILVMLTNGRDVQRLSELLREQLGDLLPDISVKLLDWDQGAHQSNTGLADALSRIFSDPELSHMEFRGIKLASLLHTPCLQFLSQLVTMGRLVPLLEETMRGWSPDFLLAQHNYRLDGQLLQLSASQVGVPTLGLQVHLYGSDPRLSAPAVDRFLCFDHFARNLLRDATGFPGDRISVIGSVRYDASLRRARSYDSETERRAIGIAEHQKVVVVATQPISIEDNKRFVDIVLEALDEIPEAFLVIKLHPRESNARLEMFQRQVDQRGLTGRALVTKTHDIYRLLIAADLVVNMLSNVGLEAAILDRAVIAVEVDLGVDNFSLDSLGLLEAARTREDAIRQIRKLLLDPEARLTAERKRHAFFESSPELADGLALERLQKIVREAAVAGKPEK
jgi:tetratricopeptide (TPR) repeat protein